MICEACRGLKYVAKNRKERIRAIAEELSASHYDLIGLQELWVYADYELVRTKLANKLRYSKFFYRYVQLGWLQAQHLTSSSGALGAGLALFSRFPILTASIHPYSLNGSPLDVAGGDWIVGKSAASIVVDHPTLGEVEVFNTHASLPSASVLVSSYIVSRCMQKVARRDRKNAAPTVSSMLGNSLN